jgi:hemolysin III
MKNIPMVKYYDPAEERLNILTHGLGLVLSIVGLGILLFRANEQGTTMHWVSFAVFGVSLILLYAASTFYHSARDPKRRGYLKILDHAAIFILIAGTYTPFTLISLEGPTGWTIFSVVWGIAAAGVILKLFFTGRFDILSTLLYVGMGWIIVFAIKPLMANLALEGLYWLLAGGIAYTVGAILYSIKRIPFNHAIFHVFVLVGSFCHYLAILLYV